jgi:Flp pilus assembly protein TadG
MPRPPRSYRRFLASTRGIAAVEFSLVFPILLVMLLATIDAGRAVAVSMKVRAAAYALDAMANQYLYIYDSDMQQILGAAAVVLSPFSSTPASVILSQIQVSASGRATVIWSDQLNSTAYSAGHTLTIPTSLTNTSASNKVCQDSTYPSCYLLLAEVSYTYTPLFAQFITGPITLSDKVYAVPRSVTCIQRNGNIPTTC